VAIAELRDVKGLYVKARRVELTKFTGVYSSYEVPERPDLHLPTHEMSAD
jgi:adenylylsulfate kinase-like enzyme